MQENELQFRPAGRDDADITFKFFEQIQKLHADAEPEFFRQPVKDVLFREYFANVLKAPDQHIAFGCLDDIEIGYVQYFLGTSPKTIYQPERRIAHINLLAVTHEYQGQGIATKLLDYVKEQATCQGVGSIGLESWAFNISARACFEKAGFRATRGSMWLKL